MYSLVAVEDEEIIKAKEVNENVIKKTRHKEFVDVYHKMKRIQSKLDRIGTYNVCKICLSCFNDKKCILNDVINSLAYFHKIWKVNNKM